MKEPQGFRLGSMSEIRFYLNNIRLPESAPNPLLEFGADCVNPDVHRLRFYFLVRPTLLFYLVALPITHHH